MLIDSMQVPKHKQFRFDCSKAKGMDKDTQHGNCLKSGGTGTRHHVTRIYINNKERAFIHTQTSHAPEVRIHFSNNIITYNDCKLLHMFMTLQKKKNSSCVLSFLQSSLMYSFLILKHILTYHSFVQVIVLFSLKYSLDI